METSNIKSFSVYGLFGTDDVHIPFDENIKILIGENGLGKTQILNLFYYTLKLCTLKEIKEIFFKLRGFCFDKLVLEFHNTNPIEIRKDFVDNLFKEIYSHPMAEKLIEKMGFYNFEKFEILYGQNKANPNNWMETFKLYPQFQYYNFYEIVPVFDEIERKKNNMANFISDKYKNEIQTGIIQADIIGIMDCDIMYFPTYRRVEVELHNLGYNTELLNEQNSLIHFEMDDVEKRFNEIESIIDKHIKDGFSKFSSELVNQFLKDDETSEDILNKNYLENIDENDIEILLSRIGDKISDSKKDRIKEIVLSREYQYKNDSLNLLLKKLIEIYSPQKELDNSVKAFRDVCNKYLINKKVFYDESKIKIFIKSDRNDSEIALSKLSLGEKQIISIFSQIYLSGDKKRFIVLFDEPELSLSIIWQKQLLPDILNSQKCDFLLAVTHSPFIFDNELDRYAVGLNEYFKPSERVTA